jgi:hypothetical protein
VYIISWALFLFAVYELDWASWWQALLWAMLPTALVGALGYYLYLKHYNKKLTQANTWFLLGVLIIGVATPLLLRAGNVLTLGPGFAPPPAEFSKGYAIINFGNPLTDNITAPSIQGADIYVQFWSNGTTYLKTTSGISFYVPEASWYYAVKPGYWNSSGTIFAKGATPAEAYNQTYPMCLIPPKEAIHFIIIAIDWVYGAYAASEIPNGDHTLVVAYSISDGWQNNATWCDPSWVPDQFIPTGSVADQQNVSLFSLWLGWDGSLTDFRLGGSPVGHYQVYDVGTYNTTLFYSIEFDGQLMIQANFKDILGATFYIGLLDDITNLAISI